MHHVAVGLRDGILDARLPRGQHEFLEFAMCGEQNIRSRRLERDPPLGANHGIAEVDAAPDPKGSGEGFEALDDGDGGERDAIEEGGDALLKADRVA